jgi:hypothetical protein
MNKSFHSLTINSFKSGSIIVDSSLRLSQSISSTDLQTTLINSALSSAILNIDTSSISVQYVKSSSSLLLSRVDLWFRLLIFYFFANFFYNYL